MRDDETILPPEVEYALRDIVRDHKYDLIESLTKAYRLGLAAAEARHAQDLQSMADACEATRADYERRLADTAGERERELYARFVCLNNAHSALEVEHAASEARHAERAWSLIADRHPKPHARYEVRRSGFGFFVATPCYGLHYPWWVPRVPTDQGHRETDPIGMLDTDEWRALGLDG